MKRAGAAVTRDDARAGEAAALADLGAMERRGREREAEAVCEGLSGNGTGHAEAKQQPTENQQQQESAHTNGNQYDKSIGAVKMQLSFFVV